jgi:tetratricopeptide (TPR) repeat protein
MKAESRIKLALLVVFAMLTGVAVAQSNFAIVKGKAVDQQGQPIVNAQVQMRGAESGQKYDLKTNKKGEFYSMGILPGTYDVKLVKDGKDIFQFNKVQVALGQENTVDFDLQKEAANMQQQSGGAQAAGAQAGASGQSGAQGGQAGSEQAGTAPQAVDTNKPVELTEEQLKKLSPEKRKEYEEYHKAVTENTKIKGLNSVLSQAQAADKAGNPEQAVQIVSGLTQQDANRPLLWAILGQYQANAAKKQTADAKKQGYAQSAASFKKAIDLAPSATDPQTKESLPTWWNVYGSSLEGAGQYDDSVKAFETAAQMVTANPKAAAGAYYNAGVVATKSGKADVAAQEFDKAVAADPSRADAYFQKGIALAAKATTDKSGKVVVPPGTEEAFNKYLELQPNGPYADAAKAQLEFIGAKVKSSVKNK